jgi:hypothetical protein
MATDRNLHVWHASECLGRLWPASVQCSTSDSGWTRNAKRSVHCDPELASPAHEFVFR